VRYDLEAAVAVARVVDNAGGSITPDLLAVALGYSGTNNGTYLTRVANGKLFGVVGGRGARVELTDRGRRILAGEEPAASEARRQAFLAVPLFRAVIESLPTGVLEGGPELAARLTDEFGEPEEKAPMVAAKLIDSGAQARVLVGGRDGKYQVRSESEKFTPVDNQRSGLFRPAVVKSRSTQPGGGRRARLRWEREDHVDENRMWIEEEPGADTKGSRRLSGGRRIGVVAAAVVLVALVAVPLSVALTGSSGTRPPADALKHHGAEASTPGHGPAEHEVLGALSATTDSGNFDFVYHLSSTPATAVAPTTTTTTECQTYELPAGASPPLSVVGGSRSTGTASAVPSTVSKALKAEALKAGAMKAAAQKAAQKAAQNAAKAAVPMGGSTISSVGGSDGEQTVTECRGSEVATNPSEPVSGSGVSNTNPKATLIDATVGSGLQVSLRVNSTTLYEDLSSLETSLAPPASEANETGQDISGFAGITESTIGLREGAIAMIGLASPTGYLDLYQQDIDGATQTGTSTVDGVPVTVYQVAVDPTQLVNDPGITTEESQTATAAIAILKAQGYTGTTDQVSVDNSGFIREVDSVAHFSDGGTVLLDVTLSNFGCAGTVLMPGQQGPSEPPSGCTSPDTGVAPTTTTTATTVPASTTAPVVPSGTPTTVAGNTGTTTPPETPTTTPPSTPPSVGSSF
jgi:hypothetical protein